MYRMSTWLAAGLAVAALAGCGTAPAAGHMGQMPGAPGYTPASTAAHAGAPVGCLRTHTITVAGNGKAYCFRVGDKLDVFLRGTRTSMWQEPQVTGDILRGVPNGALSLVVGLTGASYEAVRPGRALMTSVRPGHRFSALIIVLGLSARSG